MFICLGSVYNKGSRSISKIVTKIKPGIVAFVCHIHFKSKVSDVYNKKNTPLKK